MSLVENVYRINFRNPTRNPYSPKQAFVSGPWLSIH
jgi:hypothetical protein